MKITRAFVPNMFTTLNMFSGFMSIIYSAQGNFISAAWFIVLAFVFDGLDGIMARITKSSSEFGVEFDSLSDVVSFGVAPSVLVYFIGLKDFNNIGILISALPMIFGGIRLARFNVQLVGFDKDYFRGLPIPSAAGVIISYVLVYYDKTAGFPDGWEKILIPLVVISSVMMLTLIRYDVMPKPTKEALKNCPFKFAVFLAVLIAIAATKGKALFVVFVIYVLSGPVRYIIEKLFCVNNKKKDNDIYDKEANGIDV